MSTRSRGQVPIAFVLLVIALAGCLGQIGVEPNDGPPEDGTDESFHLAEQFNVTLDDFDQGTEYLLFELRFEENTSLRTNYDVTLDLADRTDPERDPVEGRGACLIWQVGSNRFPYFARWLRTGVGVRAEGEEATVYTHPSTGQKQDGPGIVYGGSFEAGSRVPVLVAMSDAAEWRDLDAGTFRFQVEGDEEFRWRLVETGSLHCGTRLDDFRGGSYAKIDVNRGAPLGFGPTFTEARDLTASFEIDRRGYGWLAGGATMQYDVELEGPNGTVARNRSEGMVDSGAWADRVDLAPGSWSFHLHHLRGTDTLGVYALMDLPAWAVRSFSVADDA